MSILIKRFAILFVVVPALMLPAIAQDWIRTGTGVGGEKIRLAVPDFKISAEDPAAPQLDKTFNDVLFNDPSSPSLKKRFYRVLVEPN
jgi:TolB protein